jgi:hypothetical protein
MTTKAIARKPGEEITPTHKRNNIEKVLFVAIFVMIAIFGPFTYFTYDMIQEFKKNAPEGYVWPQISDFWFSGVFAIVCVVI